jgi:hypothetical protein
LDDSTLLFRELKKRGITTLDGGRDASQYRWEKEAVWQGKKVRWRRWAASGGNDFRRQALLGHISKKT